MIGTKLFATLTIGMTVFAAGCGETWQTKTVPILEVATPADVPASLLAKLPPKACLLSPDVATEAGPGYSVEALEKMRSCEKRDSDIVRSRFTALQEAIVDRYKDIGLLGKISVESKAKR